MKDKAKVRKIAHSHLGLLTADANNIFDLQGNMSMRIIRIEDFAEHSKLLLTKLCEYLEIEYDPVLKESTFGSKLYWGANPHYKSNKFNNLRHVTPKNVNRFEQLLFYTMNRKLNKITEYSNIKPTSIEKKLSIIWLLLPISEDFKWFKRAFSFNEYKGLLDYSGKKPSIIVMIIKLMIERIRLIKIYFRNLNDVSNYERIKNNLIKPSE